MSISEDILFEVMRPICVAMRQRNEIEKEKLDVLKKIEKDLRRKSVR